jgi:hypothetical protein
MGSSALWASPTTQLERRASPTRRRTTSRPRSRRFSQQHVHQAADDAQRLELIEYLGKDPWYKEVIAKQFSLLKKPEA